MRINKAKLAAARRASMAADLAAAFIASGAPYTCGASVTRAPALIDLAQSMAREAIGAGLRFGNSQSAACPYHVAALALGDADRLAWRALNPAAV